MQGCCWIGLLFCAGCTDPNAANFNAAAVVDDGTCNYIADSTEETGMTEDLRSYMSNTVGRVFSSNFKGDSTEPKNWGSVGYSYRGQRVSQRDIMRLVRLLFYTFSDMHNRFNRF